MAVEQIDKMGFGQHPCSETKCRATPSAACLLSLPRPSLVQLVVPPAAVGPCLYEPVEAEPLSGVQLLPSDQVGEGRVGGQAVQCRESSETGDVAAPVQQGAGAHVHEQTGDAQGVLGGGGENLERKRRES